MKKLLVFALLLNAALLTGRLWQDMPANAQVGGGDPACEQDRTLHSIDSNGDGNVGLSDAVHLLTWLFSGGPEPQVCLAGPLDFLARIAELEGQLGVCTGDLAQGNADLADCRQQLGTAVEERDALQVQLETSQQELAAVQTALGESAASLATCQGELADAQGSCAGAKGRYIDNGDGTVTDCETGLMWQTAALPILLDWWDAWIYCDNLVLGNHDDWRLPSRHEFLALDQNTAGGFPFVGRKTSPHWSSTSCEVAPEGCAWFVFFSGGVDGRGDKHSHSNVRAVRCGP